MNQHIAKGSGKPSEHHLYPIILMWGAMMSFTCLDTTAKWLSHEVNPLMTTWIRYVSSMALVTLFINQKTHPGFIRTNRLALQIVRSLLMLGSTLMNFIALYYLQLAETTSILFMTPLLVALLSGPLLGEKITARVLFVISTGLIGVLVITRPGFIIAPFAILGLPFKPSTGIHPAALLSVLGCLCYALYNITTRALALSDTAQTTTFYSNVTGVFLLAPIMPFIWSNPPSLTIWIMMFATGVFGGFGHYLMVLAHARAPAAKLAPYMYTQMLWMIIMGYLVFNDVPDIWTLSGAGLVISSGLYLLLTERKGLKLK